MFFQEAHGLAPTDEQSLTSDPYIKLTLLPEKKHRVKTRVLRKTLDPAFDETFSFYGIPLARVSELALHFVVLSFDRFSRDEVIGETLVPLSGIDLSEGRVLMSREIIKRKVRWPPISWLHIKECVEAYIPGALHSWGVGWGGCMDRLQYEPSSNCNLRQRCHFSSVT